MKVDKIIRNAKVFTSAARNFHASAFAVKDGKFVYVGDEEGLKDFEGEVIDLGGKFVMPGIIDSHVHIAIDTAFEYTFVLRLGDLHGEKLVKEDLDAICASVQISSRSQQVSFSPWR